MNNAVTKDMSIIEIVNNYPQSVEVLVKKYISHTINDLYPIN